MGVSLEAVQCKFASIIKDLSQAPTTLSQFVVWIDLCVSQYKTNGYICLNCSGKKPEPAWLEGLKEISAVSSYNENINCHKKHPNDEPKHSGACQGQETLDKSLQGQVTPAVLHQGQIALVGNEKRSVDINGNSRLSRMMKTAQPGCSYQYNAGNSRDTQTDIVPIDDESESAVYPVTLVKSNHEVSNEDINQNMNTQNISVASGSSTSQAQYRDGSQKIRNAVLVPEYPEESLTDCQLVEVDEDEITDDNSALPLLISNIKTENDEYITTGTGDGSGVPIPPGYVMVRFNASGEVVSMSGDSWSPEGNTSPKGRPRPASYIPGPVRKARTNVGNMHRWLKDVHQDFRNIEDMPPQELDQYLSDFLSELRKKDGRDYDPNSFKDVRGSIDRHLRDHGYPHSIVRSNLFPKSLRAYHKKKEHLRMGLRLRKGDLSYIIA